MKRSIALKRQAGVTLTELLVVVVIIGILSTIAVPVYINKAESARIATAQAECRMIAEAQEACQLNHGFYVPLQVLDDMPAVQGSSTYADNIDQEPTMSLIDPNAPLVSLNQGQPQLTPSSSDARIARLISTWQGPFLNPQRVYKGDQPTNDPSILGSRTHYDHPLDPWGNPYLFYAPTPYGVIGTGAASFAQSAGLNSAATNMDNNSNFSNGVISSGGTGVEYDRYAIVSLGPNGKQDEQTISNTTNNDDIAYLFGRIVPLATANGSTTNTTTSTGGGASGGFMRW